MRVSECNYISRSVMPIVNFSLVIACALFLNFPARSQVPGSGETVERLKQRALALMEQGRVKEAVATFREALQSAPRDAEILNDLGMALRTDGDLAGSLEALQSAVEVRHSDPRIHRNV